MTEIRVGPPSLPVAAAKAAAMPKAPAPNPPAPAAPKHQAPKDGGQHGTYRQGPHAAKTMTLPHGSAPPHAGHAPAPAAKLTDAQKKAVVVTLAKDLYVALTSSGDAASLHQAMQTFDEHAHALMGESFATGVISGLTGKVTHLANALAEAGHSPAKAAVMAAVITALVAVQGFPPLAAPVDLALAAWGGMDAARSLANAVKSAVRGKGYEAGRHAGMAAMDAAMAIVGAKAYLKAADKIIAHSQGGITAAEGAQGVMAGARAAIARGGQNALKEAGHIVKQPGELTHVTETGTRASAWSGDSDHATGSPRPQAKALPSPRPGPPPPPKVSATSALPQPGPRRPS